MSDVDGNAQIEDLDRGHRRQGAAVQFVDRVARASTADQVIDVALAKG